jgi:thioredoxin-related protein
MAGGCELWQGNFTNKPAVLSMTPMILTQRPHTMKSTALFVLSSMLLSFSGWHYDLTEAKEIAKKEHRHILLNFSGSDWCGPCIRLRKEIFEDQSFKSFADSTLVLVNADFPRMKKNRLQAKQQDLNNAMADQYNWQGKFPYTVLLTAEGKVLKDWDGFQGEKADAFISEVQTIIALDK